MLAGLPWIWSILLVATINGVFLLDAMYADTAHCSSHSHGHLHVCSSNDYLLASGALELTIVGGLLSLVVLNWARMIVRERSLYKKLAMLSRLSRGTRKLRIVDGVAPLALAVGIRDSFVLLSRSLLSQLTLRQRRVVLAHEAAHLRRGDSLRNIFFEAMLAVYPFWQARRLRQHWRQALEEGADDSAVEVFGRGAVAETLIKVARVSKLNRCGTFAMPGAGTIQRIERLIKPSEVQQQYFPWFETLHLSSLMGVTLVGAYYHHGMETLAAWLIGG